MNSEHSTNSHRRISPPARLLPERCLPPYSYLSGRYPHPTQNAAGHSFHAEVRPVSISRPEEWRQCEAFLWGIDLFNHGYYWEAHETWESVWHAAGRRGTIADFCKALIKLAAAGVKAREGRANGVKQHAQRAKRLLASIATQVGSRQQRFMGLSLPALILSAEQLADDPAAVINTSSEPVVVVMPFVLQVTTD